MERRIKELVPDLDGPHGIPVYHTEFGDFCKLSAVKRTIAELDNKIAELEKENQKLHNSDTWLTNGNCDGIQDSGDTWGTFQ